MNSPYLTCRRKTQSATVPLSIPLQTKKVHNPPNNATNLLEQEVVAAKRQWSNTFPALISSPLYKNGSESQGYLVTLARHQASVRKAELSY